MLAKPNKKQNTQKNTTAEPVNLLNVEEYKIDLSIEKIEQDVLIYIQQKVILTAGSLMVLTGKPKARKTTFLHAFLAAGILNDSIWNIKVNVPENKNKIVLIDTEQSHYDLYQTLGRLSAMIGRKLSTVSNFQVYSARAGDVAVICQLIMTICEKNPDVSILAIDGLIDLVNDINDVREAKQAITFLKQICDKYQVGIIGIIHQNKGTNFSLGHLGSFAERFAQSQFSIEKNEDGTSTLKSVMLRSADDIMDITIGFDSKYNRYDLVGNLNISPNFLSFEILNEIFNGKVALTYKDLVSQSKIVLKLNNYQVEKKIIPIWYAERFIEKRGNLIQICSSN